MGRFIAADDPESAKGTSDEEAALKDEEGNPISNPARQSWVTAVAITTALNTSYMAEQLSIFGMVVGVALLLTGVGLVILAFLILHILQFRLGPSEAEGYTTQLSGGQEARDLYRVVAESQHHQP